MNRKDQVEKKTLENVTSQKLQEVRIVAIKEKFKPKVTKIKNIKKKPIIKSKLAPKKTALKKNDTNNLPRKKHASIVKKYKKVLPKKNQQSGRLKTANYRLNWQMIDVGRRLIDKKGSVPIVSASYKHIGFNAYLKKMKALGGKLYVGDAYQKKILAEVNFINENGGHAFSGFDSGNLDNIEAMALFRPREITGEHLVYEILHNARKFFKGNDLRCVILLPLETEAAFLGALKQYLYSSGYLLSQFDVFWGNYFRKGSQFGLKVERGRMRSTQRIISLNMVLII